MNQQDYFDMGFDGERWWHQHVKQFMPYLKHVPCTGYDFKGTTAEKTVYVDVKFLKGEYRKKGWLEFKAWGNISGIIKTARDNFVDDNVDVYIAILTKGRYYIIDAKKVVDAFVKGELSVHTGLSEDVNGNVTENKHVIMDGWDDPRFIVHEGAMKIALWQPQTSIGKKIDIVAWMRGEWRLKLSDKLKKMLLNKK